MTVAGSGPAGESVSHGALNLTLDAQSDGDAERLSIATTATANGMDGNAAT